MLGGRRDPYCASVPAGGHCKLTVGGRQCQGPGLASPVSAHALQDSQLQRQCNEGKWEFSLQGDGDVVVLDVAVGRYLDSSLIRADVQPGLVRLLIKVCLLSCMLQASACCL